MCRLSAFFGEPICAADLVTRPSRSIITQSFDARERMAGDASTPGYLNGDGFGLGWYSTDKTDPLPCVYRQARPAWNDCNLGMLAEKIYSPVLFAHVRAASLGMDVSETTCHPFRCGRYLWMHNGGLGAFKAVRRLILPTLNSDAFDFAVANGSSDSALCFAVFLNLIPDKMADSTPDELRQRLDTTLRTLQRAVRRSGESELSLLNFVVSNGDTLVASRFVYNPCDPDAQAASLYHASGNNYVADAGSTKDYRMVHLDRRPSLAIISSEPLTESREDWVPVPRNHIIVVTATLHVLLVAVGQDSDEVSRTLADLDKRAVTESLNQNAPGVAMPKKIYSDRKPPQSILGKEKESERGAGASRREFACHRVEELAEKDANHKLTRRYSITTKGRAVLSMAMWGMFLCSGTDDGTIRIWNTRDRTEVLVASKHLGAVLALAVDMSSQVLVSASSDARICFWTCQGTGSVQCVCVVSFVGFGPVFSLEIVNGTVFAGFADAGVRRLQLTINDILSKVKCVSSEDSPIDNVETGGVSGEAYSVPLELRWSGDSPGGDVADEKFMLPGHYGYVYALTLCRLERDFLCTGCGDGMLRLWELGTQKNVRTMDGHTGAVLALAMVKLKGLNLLFSGSRDGTVKVWDADHGFLCKRTLRKHMDEVVCCSAGTDTVLSGSADGQIYLWCSRTLHCVASYRCDSLQSGVYCRLPDVVFVSSGLSVVEAVEVESACELDEKDIGKLSLGVLAQTDGGTKADVERTLQCAVAPGDFSHTAGNGLGENGGVRANGLHTGDTLDPKANSASGPRSPVGKAAEEYLSEKQLLLSAMTKFIALPTVSTSVDMREACWQGAKYLATVLEEMGGKVTMAGPLSASRRRSRSAKGPQVTLSSASHNPIVFARFACSVANAPTITFYGHYDVVPADSSEWATEPWTLTGIDEHLYGRGVTDNKGPILAMVFAVRSLLGKKRDGLGVNIAFVIEGEGERGNVGFRDALVDHKEWFGNTTLILASNSYWLGEERPCLTYGMRGTVDLCVHVTGGERNLHTGVDGGAILEPVADLLGILSTLVDSRGTVLIPGFYENVRPLSEEERRRFDEVHYDTNEYRAGTGVAKFTTSNPTELLEARWRQPSISVSALETSNKAQVYSVMPCKASAKVSVRFVPDQDPEDIVRVIQAHLKHEFGKRRSPNKLHVDIEGKGDYWLGDPQCAEYQLADRAVRKVWNQAPLYVCEGGTMPIFSFLSKTLAAPVLQVPLGQSSDGAHLPNERLRALNLFKGKEVLQYIIQELSDMHVG